MSLSDGMKPDTPPKRVCRQRARPNVTDPERFIVPGLNQHLVPRLQRQYWELRMDVPRIAAREKLPRTVVEALLRENSVPIRPEPVEVSLRKRRAA